MRSCGVERNRQVPLYVVEAESVDEVVGREGLAVVPGKSRAKRYVVSIEPSG
jgi:hypothetical protein